ncbi:GNAT family N-acetyltransferase [Dactylosporangium salmoneum]|uniref:GNAT family N-acetyltransferase n=1 Tax=Dactylosporangium salmoneum TaxID=53361 RepID=A0ABN3HGU5_9ACTN
MTISVRRLGPEDWREWRDVRLAALADAPEAFGSSLAREGAYDEAEWRAWLRPERGLKALAGGDGIIGAWVPEDRGGAVELYSMWVRPDARGRGIADALLAEALGWAEQEGRERVELWVIDGNDRARRLYERHGFRATGHTQPHPRDPEVLEHLMSRG